MTDPASSDPSRTGTLQSVRRFLRSRMARRALLWLWPPLASVATLLLLVPLMDRQLDNRLHAAQKSDADGLELKSLVRQVKQQLQEADCEATANNEAALFELKDFELDLNFVAKGISGQKAEILAVGSNTEISRERLQHIHLRWTANSGAQTANVKPGKILAAPTDVIDADAIKGDPTNEQVSLSCDRIRSPSAGSGGSAG